MDNHFLIKDEILCLLLKDMSTKKNIIFATDDYDDLDKKISFKSNMTKNLVLDYKKYIIRPRVMRTSDEKSKRTRDKAEVFTPSWLCNYMNNQLDEEWFGRKNVFNESTNEKWTIKKNNIKFPKNNTWKDYIKLKKIEITCGDMYMKSGLYIAEIVKRLYNSKKMKEIYKDDKERLIHIFEKQVFGLAPTEIIYKISTNFILGFDEKMKNKKHNFKLLDIVPYAKDKKASEKLDELYK